MRNRFCNRLCRTLISAATVAAWGLLSVGHVCGQAEDLPPRSGASPTLPPADTENVSGLQFAAAIEQSLEGAIARAEKSVVAIARVRRSAREQGLLSDSRLLPFGGAAPSLGDPLPTDPDFVPSEFATGVVIDALGLVLTNYHVLGEDSDYYITTGDRQTYPARVKAADPRSDLAVLSIDARNLTPMSWGDASQLKKGQIVVALGNPYAIARDGQVSASWGIVSNLQRKAGRTADDALSSGKPTLHHLGTLIQTDAKLNLGTSGGALINLRGEMVGLTTSQAAAAGYEQAAGYAIPVDDTFKRIVESLKQGREVEYGFLGVQPGNIRPDVVGLARHGVIVQDVVEGTPAAKVGIERSDVITHVAGIPIYDFDGLMLHVGSHAAGERVNLTVQRGARQQPMQVTLAKYRVPGKQIITQPEPTWRGLQVDYWTSAVDLRMDRDGLRQIDPDGCVVITQVTEGSPAEAAGLKPGMAISHVADARIGTPKEFRLAVNQVADDTADGRVTLRLVLPLADGQQQVAVGP